MKKYRTITLISFLSVLFVVAQPASAQLMDYGLKGGLNLSTITKMNDTEYLSGFHFGAFLNIRPFFSPIGIQPELLYSQLGSEVMPDGIGMLPRESLKIDYVQIPVLMKYYLPLPGPIDPHLYAGPYLGFMANTAYPEEWDERSSQDWDETIRDRDYGVVFGVGTELRLLVAAFQFDARYTYGLQTVFEDEFENGEKHRVFSLSVGFIF